jgi:hypothetical protein
MVAEKSMPVVLKAWVDEGLRKAIKRDFQPGGVKKGQLGV